MFRDLVFHGKSVMGRERGENQDRLVAATLPDAALLAVADGMGGPEGGGLASEEAVLFLTSRIEGMINDPRALGQLLRDAGDDISAMASKTNLPGMGTTLTVAVLAHRRAVWAHAGDSRLYLLRAGKLDQISTDHRFIQDLIDSGDVPLEEVKRHPLRNVLDQCLGCPGLAPDCGAFALRFGDLVILTSDGVHDHVDSETLRDLLRADSDLSEIADSLIASALSAGSCDDLSVVLCRVAG